MFAYKKILVNLFFHICFLFVIFHLFLIYFVFVAQAELQLHFHNFHFEHFLKGGGATVLRALAFIMGDCQHFWTISLFGFLVKAFGNGNGIDGTEMELLTAPWISSAMSRFPCSCLSLTLTLSLCLICGVLLSRSQFVSQWLAKVLWRPFSWQGTGGCGRRKCHLIPYRRDMKSVDVATTNKKQNREKEKEVER